MATIINNYVANFNSKIENFLNTSEDLSIKNAEAELLKLACEFATQMLSAKYESKDREIRENKTFRKEQGLVIERYNDKRDVVTRLGVLRFNRTYYKKKSGGYEYPVDEYAGIDSYERVSGGTSLALVESATHQSYRKASLEVTDGVVSPQTVMNYIRKTYVPPVKAENELRKVPFLHIDADEDHVKKYHGKGAGVIVPLVTVYEGMKNIGKRRMCINCFSISEYGKRADAIWEDVLTEIESKYDLTDTQIYIHCDGGAWIKGAAEWLPGAKFVLDQYHKNKYIKKSTAGFSGEECDKFQKEIRKTLDAGKKEDILTIKAEMCKAHPEKQENIETCTGYLYNNFEAIDIRRTDKEANNGGCTEPHVSHILSSRLSTRPMAWSDETLKHIVPILGAKRFTFEKPVEEEPKDEATGNRANAVEEKAKIAKNSLGLPDPDKASDVAASFGGHLCGVYGMLKSLLGF